MSDAHLICRRVPKWGFAKVLFGLVLVVTTFAPAVAFEDHDQPSASSDLHQEATKKHQPLSVAEHEHRRAQFGWLTDWFSPDVGVRAVCSADQVLNDNCIYRNDGECDAGTSDTDECDVGTDCVDCDPCSARSASCNDCVNGGADNENSTSCVWCITSSGEGICSSTTLAAILPLMCSPDGTTNSTFYDTCTDVVTVTPNITEPEDDPAVPYSCDSKADTCRFPNDGKCDRSFFACRGENSDCVDCDPCQAHRFQGCDACIAAPEGCVWCGADSWCKSPGTTIPDSRVTCSEADFVDTCSPSTASFSDALFEPMEWLYDMVRIKPVWEAGYTGAGVGIRINDEGVDSNHPDFSTKFDKESSCQLFDPLVLDAKHNHGTTCASLAAGNADGSCSVGMAPDATISSCRIIGELNFTQEVLDGSYLFVNMEAMHISSNSYQDKSCRPDFFRRNRRLQACPFSSVLPLSPCLAIECFGADWGNPHPLCNAVISRYCDAETQNDAEACTATLDWYTKCEFNSQGPQVEAGLLKGATEGRDGKGIIYVYGSGNDYGFGSDVGFIGTLNNRFVISVGAVGKDGVQSTYSMGGSALTVTAPAGDIETYPNNLVALAGGGCTEGDVGTSNACPIVSGIVALMLQANNNLSWRDVQGVIASTSQQVQPNDPTWTTNAAGFHHSYVYGFGLIDATAAVNAARTWANFNNETEIMGDSGALNLSIPEFPSEAVESTISISSSSTFATESVAVYLDLAHSSRGHLEISLTSPQGTVSILSPGGRPESNQWSEPWMLKTVRNWGESPNGEWTLRVADRSEGDFTACVDVAGWSLNFGNETAPVNFDCEVAARLKACAYGAPSPSFGDIFGGLDINDPIFADANNVSLVDACCLCGGGLPASSVVDELKSWQLTVYGHDGRSAPATPGPNAPMVVAVNSTTPTVVATNGGGSNTTTPTASAPSPASCSSGNTTGGAASSGGGITGGCEWLYGWKQTVVLVVALAQIFH